MDQGGAVGHIDKEIRGQDYNGSSSPGMQGGIKDWVSCLGIWLWEVGGTTQDTVRSGHVEGQGKIMICQVAKT